MQVPSEDFREMKNKVDKMYYALLGNELTEDGGLIRRVGESEKEIALLHDRIDQLERKNIKGELYLNWLWGLAGFVLSSGFSALIYHLFKK
ncbi:MAG TPA: hypothetical protein VGM31_14205 [Puia sp.]